MTAHIKAVLFDADGTLFNSTEIDFLAWQQVFASYGRQLKYDHYVPLLGLRSGDVARDVLGLSGRAVDDALQARLHWVFYLATQKGVQATPYVRDFLKSIRLRGVKLAVATGSRRVKVERFLQDTNLDVFFDALVTGDDVRHGKPAPDIFLEAARRLKTAPHHCIVVEDAPQGIEAARQAGMMCVAITTTNAKAALRRADLVIETFKDLTFDNLCSQLAPLAQ